MSARGITRGRTAGPPPVADRAAAMRAKREQASQAPPELDDLGNVLRIRKVEPTPTVETVSPGAPEPSEPVVELRTPSPASDDAPVARASEPEPVVPAAEPVAPAAEPEPAALAAVPPDQQGPIVAPVTPAPAAVDSAPAPSAPSIAAISAPSLVTATSVPAATAPLAGETSEAPAVPRRSPAMPLLRTRERSATRTITYSKSIDDAVKQWRRARLALGPGYTMAAMFIAAVSDLPTTVEEAQDLIAITPNEVFDGGRDQTTAALPDDVWQRVNMLAENIRIEHKQLQVPPWMVHAAAINRQLLAEGLGLGWKTY